MMWASIELITTNPVWAKVGIKGLYGIQFPYSWAQKVMYLIACCMDKISM